MTPPGGRPSPRGHFTHLSRCSWMLCGMGWGLSRRARARLLTAIAALAASVVLVPTGASAHSELVASNPSDDSVVDHIPDHVVLEFVDPVSVDDDSVQVVGPDGEDRAIGVLGSDTGRLVSIVVGSGGSRGSWQIRYRVLGADGHAVSGRVDFSVGEPSGGLGGLELTPLAAGSIIVLVAAVGYLFMAPRLVRDLEEVR